jgi:hypothetical protein
MLCTSESTHLLHPLDLWGHGLYIARQLARTCVRPTTLRLMASPMLCERLHASCGSKPLAAPNGAAQREPASGDVRALRTDAVGDTPPTLGWVA